MNLVFFRDTWLGLIFSTYSWNRDVRGIFFTPMLVPQRRLTDHGGLVLCGLRIDFVWYFDRFPYFLIRSDANEIATRLASNETIHTWAAYRRP